MFGELVLDAARLELSRGGQRLAVQRKPLQLLIYLCLHQDRLVPAAELLREVWRDIAVTEASLRGAIKVLRRIIAGSAVIQSSRGFGYRFRPLANPLNELDLGHQEPLPRSGRILRVAQSEASVSHSGAPVSVRRPKPLFVGRGEELGVLEGALDHSLAGDSRPVLLVAPAGMGKTRLAREFSESARARGVRTVLGQCWEGQGTPPFWPWGSVLQQLSGGELGLPLELDAAPTRFRWFADIATLLRKRAEQEPLLLVFEDLHWAQEPALLLLNFVVEQLQSSRLLVVGTCRNLDFDRDGSSAKLVGALEARGTLVSLRPLNQTDVTALLESTSNLQITPELSTKVFQWTGGNPLFVHELIPLLEEHRADDLSQLAAPAGVREAIRVQLGPLNERGRRLLATCAVIGEDFELSLLSRVAEEPCEQVQEVLRNAAARRILTETAAGKYRFTHALIREVLASDLAAVDRANVHLCIAEALDELDTGSDTHAAALAFHYAQALPALPNTSKPIAYALDAAGVAMKRLAYEQARDHCLAALSLADRAGSSVTERAEILMQLGEAQRYCGATENAKATFLQLAELGRKTHDPQLIAEGARGYGKAHTEDGRIDHTLRGLLEKALEALPKQDSPIRAELTAQLGRSMHFDVDVLRRHATSLEAVEMARRTGDPDALVMALSQRIQAIWGAQDLALRRSGPARSPKEFG